MADRGHVFRRAFSWLPAQFASQSDAPVGAPRRFGSTEHLSIEAIAAFVDGELRMNAHLRAAHHLSLCPQCAAEVEDQSRARSALRDSHPIRIPSALLGMLARFRTIRPTTRHPRYPTVSLTAMRATSVSAGSLSPCNQKTVDTRVDTNNAVPGACPYVGPVSGLSRAPR